MDDKCLLFAVLFIAGCSTVAERNIPIATPKQWTAEKTTGNISTHWLTEFNDQQLTALVNEAFRQNYDLKAAVLRVNAAREQANIEGAARLPQLNVSPSYQRGNGLKNPAVLFNLSWELDVWGRIANVQQAASQEAEAVTNDFQAAQLSLAARVAQSYFDLLEANLQVSVAAQSVKDRSTIAELIRGRFSRGLSSGLDLRLVLTDVANAEAQLATARNQVQIINRRLEVLLGRYPSDNLKQTAQLPMPPNALSAGLPSELLTRRPDLIAAFQRIQAANSRLASAHQELLPRISLTASGGISSAALAELIDPRAAAWNVLMNLIQPIFTGDRLESNIRLNQAQTEEVVNLYQSAALNAFREVEQALAAEQWLRTQEQALEQAVQQTEASRRLAVYSYQQGLIDILTLLDSYRSTFNAQSDHLIVQRQLLNNRIDLYLALGGAV